MSTTIDWRAAREDRRRANTLRSERAAVWSKMKSLADGATEASRDLTEAEYSEYETHEAQLEGLSRQIDELDPPLSKAVERGMVDAPKVRAGSWLAGELRALTGGTGLGGAITPLQPATYVLDHLAAASVGLKSGFTVLNTDRDSLAIPHTTSDGSAAWTAEGAAITPGDVAGTTITATPKKLAAYEIASNEVVNDANPDVLAVVEARLLRGLANTLDLGFFEGTGASNQPSGLKTVLTSGQQVSMGTNGAAPTNLDPFASAITLLETGNANATAIVMHPRTWGELLKLKELTSTSNKPLLSESAGAPTGDVIRSLYGIPVYLSSQLSITETQGTSGAVCSSAYVYDASRIYAVRRQDVQLEVDRSVLFNTDQTAIRAISRWDIVVPDIPAAVRILGIL